MDQCYNACAGVSASTAHTWTTLSGSGAEDVRVMTRKSIDDPGRPPDIVLSAATSFWLPIPHKRIFEFLRNEANRPQNMFQQSVFDPHRGLLDMATTTQTDIGRLKDDEFDSKSGSENLEGLSADEETAANQRKRKKRYHRHTQHQIQEMEAFFKECPHPDDKQRKELGLEPLQVKFWFQNKRTQVKTQTERHENQQLRTENEKLRAENNRFKEVLASASCPTCGGPITIGEMSFDDSPLRLENVRLREEIDRISSIAARYVGKPMMPYSMPHQLPHRSLDLVTPNFGMQQGMGGEMYGVSGIENPRQVAGTSESDRSVIVELAVSGMEELVRMTQIGEPLWLQGPDNSFEILNEEEYSRMFPRGMGARSLGMKSEASRETAVVIMNPINLVELLMDVHEWSTVFSSIISRATTMDVLSTGVAGNYNGALQVMTSEFQVASPLVPTRESFFVRYCKQHSEGTWAVVDVSLDHLRPSPVMRCRRLPSGCLIQELPNGYSKVVWVEHVEADDRAVHNIYKPLVNSTLAFGAKRWVSTLDRQSERLASLLVTNMPPGEASVITSIEGRKGMLKLAQRMVMSFCAGVVSVLVWCGFQVLEEEVIGVKKSQPAASCVRWCLLCLQVPEVLAASLVVTKLQIALPLRHEVSSKGMMILLKMYSSAFQVHRSSAVWVMILALFYGMQELGPVQPSRKRQVCYSVEYL